MDSILEGTENSLLTVNKRKRYDSTLSTESLVVLSPALRPAKADDTALISGNEDIQPNLEIVIRDKVNPEKIPLIS